MPKDTKGTVLKEGDKVYLPCTITRLGESPDGVNCNVKMDLDAEGGTSKQEFSINSRQVLLVPKEETAAEATPTPVPAEGQGEGNT